MEVLTGLQRILDEAAADPKIGTATFYEKVSRIRITFEYTHLILKGSLARVCMLLKCDFEVTL